MAARGIHPARLDLTPAERAALVRWTRRGSTAQALALRARIVLACADRPDEAHGVLARELGVHRATPRTGRRCPPTVRARAPRSRCCGSADRGRRGGPRGAVPAPGRRGRRLRRACRPGGHFSARAVTRGELARRPGCGAYLVAAVVCGGVATCALADAGPSAGLWWLAPGFLGAVVVNTLPMMAIVGLLGLLFLAPPRGCLGRVRKAPGTAVL